MHDVARLANVSQRTVSNVVRGYIHVKPETRERVLQAIAALNYRPNPSAQRLRSGRTGIVALAIPEIEAPYFSELANYVQRRAVEREITLLIDQTGGDRDRELLVLDGYRSSIIDGLILHPIAVTPNDLRHRDLDFPTVLLGESIDHGGVVHISIDNVAAARIGMQELLRRGRRRIAAVGTHPDLDAPGPAPRRSRGVLSALDQAGLPHLPELLVPTSTWTRSAGFGLTEQLLDNGAVFDALFCFNDTLALGAMRALLARGVRIPEDVAVLGWDDIDDCQYSTPTLSSVTPNKKRIAELAVQHLLDSVDGGTPEELEILVDAHLELRESTGP